MKYFILITLFTFISCYKVSAIKPVKPAVKNSQIKIMTFNMWLGGEAGKQPINKSIEVIQMANAGIVGAQETYGNATPQADNSAKMAQSMGWNHIDQGDQDATMTKYEIIESTPSKRGSKIKIGNNQFIWFFNCHLNYIPYQPYQLAAIKYGDYPFILTEEEAIKWARSTRIAEVQKIIAEVKEKMKGKWPVVVTGDFNEPSHLDWTQRAANAGICKIKVEWPSTKSFTDIGMKDAYRTFRPNEVAYPGKTWSSIDRPGEIHDRIDFIFYTGSQLKLINCEIIGEASNKTDIIVSGYPSDHRSVVATFKWIK